MYNIYIVWKVFTYLSSYYIKLNKVFYLRKPRVV